jgi:hypothetical protein
MNQEVAVRVNVVAVAVRPAAWWWLCGLSSRRGGCAAGELHVGMRGCVLLHTMR